MSLFSERSAPLDGAETVAILELMKTDAHMPPAITRTAELGGRLRAATPDADTATMAGGEQEGRARTARRPVLI